MRTNTKTQTPKIYTHEGAVAVQIDPVQQLRRSVMANMLWEDEFYEDGVSIATRIQDETAEILKEKDGPSKLADIAYEARTQMKLRHVPLLLLASLIRENKPATREIVADAISHIIQRPDEMGELIALFWKLEGKRKMLPEQMKKGLRSVFGKFSEYSLAKYDSDSSSVKIRDVMFLCHPKPVGEKRTELYKRIAAREMKTPDTWEVALSGGADKKATFTRLIEEGKLGGCAS